MDFIIKENGLYDVRTRHGLLVDVEGYPEPEGSLTITKNGTFDVKDRAEAVVEVGGGYPEPTGSVDITENGTHNVKDVAEAVVNVPNPSSGSINISANGTYDVTEKASAVVSIVNSFLPAPSEGYTELQNVCTAPFDAVKECAQVGSTQKYINVTKGVGSNVSVGDKLLFTGTITDQTAKAIYACWGTVTKIYTTPTTYDRIVVTAGGAALRPLTGEANTLSIYSEGTYDVFGTTKLEVSSSAEQVAIGVTFESQPVPQGSITVTDWSVAQADRGCCLFGRYDGVDYAVNGYVTAVADNTVSVDVYDVVGGGGGGSSFDFKTSTYQACDKYGNTVFSTSDYNDIKIYDPDTGDFAIQSVYATPHTTTNETTGEEEVIPIDSGDSILLTYDVDDGESHHEAMIPFSVESASITSDSGTDLWELTGIMPVSKYPESIPLS